MLKCLHIHPLCSPASSPWSQVGPTDVTNVAETDSYAETSAVEPVMTQANTRTHTHYVC